MKNIVSLIKRPIRKLILNVVENERGGLFFYGNEPRSVEAFKLIKQIKGETEMLLSDLEAHQIYITVKKTGKIEGDIAEVGVYKGGSAKLICEAIKGAKDVHLFDTFEGLPKLSSKDNLFDFYEKKFAAPYDEVRNYLSRYKNVYFYKGTFPTSAIPVNDKRFSFIHLDVDLYESTMDCLKFFYPRLNKGGVIISHDYIGTNGVGRAFDEFFADKPEVIFEPLIDSSQAFVVKLN